MTDPRPSIAALQRLIAPMNADASGICIGEVLDELQALVDAAPVLLEIAATALAWRDQRFANLQAALLRTESEIEAEAQEVSRARVKRTAELALAVEAALEKVRP